MHNFKYVITDGVAYKFSNPSGMKEFPIQNLKIQRGSNEERVYGIFLDIERPYSSKNVYKTDLFDLASLWTSNAMGNTNGATKWLKSIENLEEVFEGDPKGLIKIYNEMVYFSDSKTKIGAFIRPLWDMMNEVSKIEVMRIAKKHATDIAERLKNGYLPKTDSWPCDVAFTGSHTELEKWNKKIKSGQELPTDFNFQVNEQNVMLWYLDYIMHNPNKQIDLTIIDEPKIHEMIKILTLNRNRDVTFKLSEIIVYHRQDKYTKEIKHLLFENQEGIVRYFGMLERKARTVTADTGEIFETAIKNLKNKSGSSYTPFDDESGLLPRYLASQVIPPNIVKTPSGKYVYFLGKNERNSPFLPFIANVEEYQKIISELDIPETSMELFFELNDRLTKQVNDIDNLATKVTDFTRRNFIDNIGDHVEEFIKSINNVKGSFNKVLD
ncbi:MAG: hypothetical protein D6732_14885, partial [Methanobacteriota archaeon]